MVPPAARAPMARRIGATVSGTPGSRTIHVSRPGVFADLVRKAAAALARAGCHPDRPGGTAGQEASRLTAMAAMPFM